MNFSVLKGILIKRAKCIFLIGLLCAFCAAGSKFLFTPASSLRGDYIYGRIIQIEDKKESINNFHKFNYLGIINTNHCYLNLLESTDGKTFDYRKLNSGWNRLSKNNKINWLRQQIQFRDYNENFFEIVFILPPSGVSDLTYLVDNIDEFMNVFTLNAQESIRKLKPNVTIKSIGSATILPEEIKIDKVRVSAKNAVYGFVAGIVLSMSIFLGIPLFKNFYK